MSLALEKQFVLMLHKHIHPDFWRKAVAKDVCEKVLALRQKRGE